MARIAPEISINASTRGLAPYARNPYYGFRAASGNNEGLEPEGKPCITYSPIPEYSRNGRPKPLLSIRGGF
jgi:hypothetical protein